jgi:hypothetical protein
MAGRPGRAGWVDQRRATSWRCQRRIVDGVGLQRTFQDRLGHLVEQSVDAVDRSAGSLRVREERIDHRRIECLGEPAGRRSLGVGIGLVLAHVGVPSDRHVDHNGRSWVTRGLHRWHDT